MAPPSYEARIEGALRSMWSPETRLHLPGAVVEGFPGLVEVDGVVFCGVDRLGSSATMTVLARTCGLDRSVTSRHVDVLETTGLVARVAHASDARSILVEYTDAGAEVLVEARDRLRRRYRRQLAALSHDERAQFVGLLERFAEGLEDV